MTSTPAWIALGSNLNDRLAMLRFAVASFEKEQGLAVSGTSPIYETEAVGPAGQGPYLNAVVALEVKLGPHALLAVLMKIEEAAGRTRSGLRNEARVLDLDLLAFGGLSLYAPDLVIPHPRLHLRDFVLVPLRVVAPDWKHPESGRSVDALIDALQSPPALEALEGETLWPSSQSASRP
jgi:2-amino-4-hydroxy-6-hydroxymethyldihydropteridine diphosphokinase